MTLTECSNRNILNHYYINFTCIDIVYHVLYIREESPPSEKMLNLEDQEKKL